GLSGSASQDVHLGGKFCEMHTLFARLNSSEILPYFIAGETHNRCQQSHHRFADSPKNGLSGTASDRVRSIRIQPVLNDVGVESAQFNSTEMIDALIDFVECKFFVPADNVGRKLRSDPQNVLINREHLLERHRICRREIIEITETVLEQVVADSAIVLRDALHQVLGADNVFA